jgi:hypothetical protein
MISISILTFSLVLLILSLFKPDINEINDVDDDDGVVVDDDGDDGDDDDDDDDDDSDSDDSDTTSDNSSIKIFIFQSNFTSLLTSDTTTVINLIIEETITI